jgi:hypothetical protein
MAYMVLDTTTNIMWHYKKATSNAWLRLNLLPSDTASMLTPYWRSGRFSGTLPVANGGTGSATKNFVDLTTTQNIGGAKTLTSALAGTSATFTATITPLILKSTEATTMWTEYYYNTSTLSGYIGSGSGILSGANNSDFITRSEADFVVATGGNNRRLTIASTGAATFNSSVTANSLSLTTPLAVANGGTNRTTMPTGYILHGDGTSVDTSVNLFWDRTNSRLGIGTTSPTEKLSVNGNINTTSNTNYFLFGTNVAANPYFQGTSTNQFILGTGNLPRLLVESNGNIRIYSLEGIGGRTVEADANGVLSAPVSSINSKQNVQTLNYGLTELLQINPVSFNYINKDKWGEERNLGFIVEDMFPVIPEVTGTMNNGDMYLDMTKLIPVLTKAIQEQQALIKALEQRIINLENK